MKKILMLAAIVCGSVLALPARAQSAQSAPEPEAAAAIPPDQQPSPEQLAKLFEAMRIRRQVQAISRIMPQLIQQQFHAQIQEIMAKTAPGTKLTEQQQAQLEAIMGKYTEKALNLYTADDIIREMTAIYRRHLTKDDVDAYIVFYTSPAGQHLLDAQPVIVKEYLPVVMRHQQAATEELTAEMEKDLEAFAEAVAAERKSSPAKIQPAPTH